MRMLTAALVVALLLPATARAVGEDEWQLSARLGIGNLHIDDRSPFGPVLGLELEHGLSDAWALRLMVGQSVHSVDERMSDHAPGGWARTSSLLAGLTYTFDVLRMVPYAQLAIGYLRFDGAVKASRAEMAGELGLGADYWLTKRWAVGG